MISQTRKTGKRRKNRKERINNYLDKDDSEDSDKLVKKMIRTSELNHYYLSSIKDCDENTCVMFKQKLICWSYYEALKSTLFELGVWVFYMLNREIREAKLALGSNKGDELDIRIMLRRTPLGANRTLGKGLLKSVNGCQFAPKNCYVITHHIGQVKKLDSHKVMDMPQEAPNLNTFEETEVKSEDQVRGGLLGKIWTTPSMAWVEGTLPITLQSGDAEKWWNNEINGTTITWSELNDKFFHKYYPLSHTCNSKIPDDLDNGTNYFEFIYWLASKFDNYWEIDKNTKNGLWEFYVNERAKGTIGDLDEYKEPCKKTCSDTFYKPYLDAQEAKDIYEVINREYSLIPIPSRRDINNPDELCITEEFIVVRHSIGNDEEFVTVGPSKINIVELLATCLASTISSSTRKIADGK
ncbi:hypothetical protein Tco_1353224 [Tanacetum coccineum]